MIKIHLSLLLLSFFSLSVANANANELNSIKKQDLSSIELVKVNKHIVTSAVLGPKKLHALIHKFTKSEKVSIINQLINDEIAIQYAYKYLKIEDNMSNEKERLNFGLQQINNIALTESIKNISDKNASTFYEAHRKDYWHAKHHEASHILVHDKNISIKLSNLLKKSSDLNSTFQTLAKKYSKDRSSKNGGYLGHFESKIMVKPFKTTLEKLNIGTYTQKAIKTRFGYHIILLHSIKKEGYFSFEEIKETIKLKLAKEIKDKWFEQTLLPIKKKAKINYLLDMNSTH